METSPGCDLYAAGFPCQPHSSEGNKRGFEDPRGQVFYSVVDYMRTHKPRVAVLENVQILAEAAGQVGGPWYHWVTCRNEGCDGCCADGDSLGAALHYENYQRGFKRARA